MEAITTAFTTAMTTIQGDVTTLVAAAIAPALVICGIFLAPKLGVRFFKSVAIKYNAQHEAVRFRPYRLFCISNQ